MYTVYKVSFKGFIQGKYFVTFWFLQLTICKDLNPLLLREIHPECPD
jgi:hypothetical protein